MNFNKLVNNFKNILLKNNIDYPISIVGSAIKNNNYNDVDFLMVVDNIELVIERINEAFKNLVVTKSDDAIRIDNFSKKTFSIALYEEKRIIQIINDYIEGKNLETTHRIWCLGYWIPESLIINLKDMIILNDKNDFMIDLKNKLSKDSIYAKKAIVKECLEEIRVKSELLSNISINSMEYSFYKNDIILSTVRAFSIVKGNFLMSFKKLEQVIKNLDCDELNSFISGKNNTDEIIKKLENYLLTNSLYLGTWQFSGDFKKLTEKEIISLIKYAKKNGVHLFDTALVYGKGNVEKILGRVLEPSDIILTKVPARNKPPLENPNELSEYYDYDYILDCINKSLLNLNRKKIDICLLHNWTYKWNNEPLMIDILQKIKNSGLVDKIGISLPNMFNNELSDQVLKVIDVIESPYNSENNWILNSIDKYKKYGIEIILRSLFEQGKLQDKTKYNHILKNAVKKGTSLVVGMTTNDQIDNNIKTIKGEF